MGIFFTPPQHPLLATKTAIEKALVADPKSLANPADEAASRTVELTKAIQPTFKPSRFVGALAIAGALLYGSIWTAQRDLPDISKTLLDLFSGFGGLVLGLLGGESKAAS